MSPSRRSVARSQSVECSGNMSALTIRTCSRVTACLVLFVNRLGNDSTPEAVHSRRRERSSRCFGCRAPTMEWRNVAHQDLSPANRAAAPAGHANPLAVSGERAVQRARREVRRVVVRVLGQAGGEFYACWRLTTCSAPPVIIRSPPGRGNPQSCSPPHPAGSEERCGRSEQCDAGAWRRRGDIQRRLGVA